MNDPIFEWDEKKNKANISKHGISFKEASSAFFDDDAITIFDSEHSQDEERFVLLGLSKVERLLVVCHCYRNDNDIIRIISARKANDSEALQYGGGL